MLGSAPDGFPVSIEQVTSETALGQTLGYFMIDDALLVAEQADASGNVPVNGRAEVVIGRVLGTTDHPNCFAGFRVTFSASPCGESNITQSIFLLIAAFQSASRLVPLVAPRA